MNRYQNQTVEQCPRRTFNKTVVAIAMVAFCWLSVFPVSAQAQRKLKVIRPPVGQVAEKPLPPGSAYNAPVILRGSVIDKRSITIRFKNKATNVSKFEVERQYAGRAWQTVKTYKIGVASRALVPSKIDSGPRPGATYTFHDTRLSPGSTFRYRVTATQSNKPSPIKLVSAVRTITTKPLDLPAAPSNLKVVGTTESTISVTWKDNSNNENGFTYYYRVRSNVGSNVGAGSGNISSANQTSVDLTQLSSGTEYVIKVSSRNGDGDSWSDPLYARTKGSNPTPETTVVIKTIYLKAQPIGQGPRPFLATWPAFGTLSGKLTKIEIPKNFGQTYQFHFVKPGHSTQECITNPDAAVTLVSGQTSTPSQISEIFGTSQPKFPLTFLACVGAIQGSVPDSVGIKITYTKTN